MNTWYYSDSLQTYGPVAVQQLTAMIQAGQLTAAHFIMPDGGAEWQTVAASPFAAYLPMAPAAPAAVPAAFAPAPAPQSKPQAPAKSAAPASPAGPPKPVMRPAGQPGPKKPSPQHTPASSGTPIWIPVVAGIVVLAGVGWWLTRPVPVLERTTTTRIEGEAMKVLKVTGGDVETQPMGHFPTGRWSGNSQLFWSNGAKKYVLHLGFKIEAAEAGKQRLSAVLTGARDYAVVKVSLNGKSLPGSPIDMRRPDVVTSEVLDWGIHQLAAGDHTLQFEILDSKAESPEDHDKYSFGLDYIQLDPPSFKPADSDKPVAAPALAKNEAARSQIQIRPSRRQGPKVGIRFINRLNEEVVHHWVDREGKLVKYGTVKAGGEGGLGTYGGHVWLITNLAGDHLGLVEAADTQSTVIIDATGVLLESSTPPQIKPSENLSIVPSPEGGDPAMLRFHNKLNEEVELKWVNTKGKPVVRGAVRAGRSAQQHTYIGHHWLITTKDGKQLGLAEVLAEESSVTVDNQGVRCKEYEPPTRQSQQLVSMVQLTNGSIGEAVELLRQRVTEEGYKAQIELDPRVDPKAGNMNLDTPVIPLWEIIEICADSAGARMDRQGNTYRIIPR